MDTSCACSFCCMSRSCCCPKGTSPFILVSVKRLRASIGKFVRFCNSDAGQGGVISDTFHVTQKISAPLWKRKYSGQKTRFSQPRPYPKNGFTNDKRIWECYMRLLDPNGETKVYLRSFEARWSLNILFVHLVLWLLFDSVGLLGQL